MIDSTPPSQPQEACQSVKQFTFVDSPPPAVAPPPKQLCCRSCMSTQCVYERFLTCMSTQRKGYPYHILSYLIHKCPLTIHASELQWRSNWVLEPTSEPQRRPKWLREAGSLPPENPPVHRKLFSFTREPLSFSCNKPRKYSVQTYNEHKSAYGEFCGA